jgi:hypothetical protein
MGTKMLVGHLGAGLAAKAVEPKLKLGTLFAAAMLLDIALWIFVMLGVEATTVPANYAEHHYLLFNFPYSHSLLAALLWSVAAGLAWAALSRREFGQRFFSTAGIILMLTVFSHWVLDFLVHPSQLPIAPGGPTLGLDLWDQQPLALEIELAIAGVGLFFYLVRAGVSWRRRVAVVGVTLAAAVFTVWGALSPTPPPSISLVAYVSLLTIAVIVGVAAWADRAG